MAQESECNSWVTSSSDKFSRTFISEFFRLKIADYVACSWWVLSGKFGVLIFSSIQLFENFGEYSGWEIDFQIHIKTVTKIVCKASLIVYEFWPLQCCFNFASKFISCKFSLMKFSKHILAIWDVPSVSSLYLSLLSLFCFSMYQRKQTPTPALFLLQKISEASFSALTNIELFWKQSLTFKISTSPGVQWIFCEKKLWFFAASLACWMSAMPSPVTYCLNTKHTGFNAFNFNL